MDLNNIMPQVGQIDWTGVRPTKKANLIALDQVLVIKDTGLLGDHYSKKGKKRQVTFIQSEHIYFLKKILRKREIHPGLLRRNIVISGINLLALEGKVFSIGLALFEMTGSCPPCSRMEENLGPGGYNAMRSHGGITTSVLRGGKIKLGDHVRMIKN